MVTVPISNANTTHMDIDLFVAQAQDKKWREQIWVEEDWKTWKEEWRNVVASNKVVAEKAREKAVNQMMMIFCQVSFFFLISLDYYLEFDWLLSSGIGGVSDDAWAIIGTMEMEGKAGKFQTPLDLRLELKTKTDGGWN